MKKKIFRLICICVNYSIVNSNYFFRNIIESLSIKTYTP